MRQLLKFKLHLKIEILSIFQFSSLTEMNYSTLTTNLTTVALKYLFPFVSGRTGRVTSFCGSVLPSSLPCLAEVTSFYLKEGTVYRGSFFTSVLPGGKSQKAQREASLSCSMRNTNKNKRTREELRNRSISEWAGELAQWGRCLPYSETKSCPWVSRHVETQRAHSHSWLW